MFYYIIKPRDTIYKLAVKYNIPMSAILSANPGINVRNLRIGQRIIIPYIFRDPDSEGPDGYLNGISIDELNLRNRLRELWEEHSVWTRMAIMSAVMDSPDASAIVERLLRNPADMAAALEPLYGRENAGQFERLLSDHLNFALQYVMALLANNTQSVQDYDRKMHENADMIAEFLNRINPYIDQNEFRNMFYEHLDLIKQEAANRINQNFADDITNYDRIADQALEMADMISEGIIMQFPDMF